uniref:Disintegrin and metalloproteinase domain-containing protein 11-like n=1 Tax=Gadus morhua TaxID=8049 RepID=A0A8C5B878_GADMO
VAAIAYWASLQTLDTDLHTHIHTHTHTPDHCYYHGRLRGEHRSWAALSTCHGLRSVQQDFNTLPGCHRHPCPPLGPPSHCKRSRSIIGYTLLLLLLLLMFPSPSSLSLSVLLLFLSVSLPLSLSLSCSVTRTQASTTFISLVFCRPLQVKPGQRTVTTETKYIELMVVNDHDLFVQLRRSFSQTKNFAKAVVNMADAIFKEQLNTRIVLVAMETWSLHNMVSVGDDPLVTLRDFMKYRKERIREHSDAVHLFSGRTFLNSKSGTAYVGGMCSVTRGGGVNEYANVGPMAITLCQTLGQNIGMMWNKQRASAGDCRCPDPWLGCIMEDTGYYLPRKFSRCSIDEYLRFLQEGGGSCLFNKPSKLLDPQECGNGFLEVGEECDCGSYLECSRSGGACCKKCTLTHDAMCSTGLCCRDCRYELRGSTCRGAVGDCDIPETCTGDSSEFIPISCLLSHQGRCYGGRCKTRDGQCLSVWGYNSADRFCYEKFNVEGSEKGNCGRDPGGHGWLPCQKLDVLCGFLMCTNLTSRPRFGEQQGEPTSLTVYHQSRYMDCRGGHAVLEDGSDLGYVEDGTPCGPNMMCLNRHCLAVNTFNLTLCPGSSPSRICSHHGTCSNEVRCICDADYTGKDCSVFDPQLCSPPGPSGTNIIIGSIAGAILVGAIVLGGTGWGFK